MSIYASISITMQCACCVGVLDQSVTFEGNKAKRNKDFRASGWLTVVEDEVYVGPRCLALYEKFKEILKLKTTAYIADPIDHSQDKPSAEIIDDFVWGYPSRYCDMGFKEGKYASKHEMIYHEDRYQKPEYDSRKKVQIHKDWMSIKSGKRLPRCQREGIT